MADAYVLNGTLDPEDKSKLDGVLAKSGYNPIHSWPADTSAINNEHDVGVVCLPTRVEESAEIGKKITQCVALGIRIICIWLDEEGELGPELEKFGSAAVKIDSPDLETILKGDTVWEEPSGSRRTEQKVPRNKC